MPLGTRGTNTQSEALKRLLADISEMKTYPDADLEFLIGLETLILGKIRAQVDGALGQAPPANPGTPSGSPGGMPGMMQGMTPPDLSGLGGSPLSAGLPGGGAGPSPGPAPGPGGPGGPGDLSGLAQSLR